MKRFFLVCLALALAACQKEAPDTRAADEQAIRDLETQWSKTGAAKDVEGFTSYYAEDASVFEPGAPIITGKPAIRTAITVLFGTPGFSSLTFQTVKVEAARSGDFAYSHGTYAITMNDPKGNPMNDKGKYVTVYKKQADGKWKAVADIINSDLPPPGAPSH